MSILDQEFASDLTVAALAERVACSCRQLQRAFREIGDTSFRTALTEIRMDRAADALRRGPIAVRDAARQVGYRQPAQFAKAFRRRHGVSPSQYRVGRRLDRLREMRGALAHAPRAA